MRIRVSCHRFVSRLADINLYVPAMVDSVTKAELFLTKAKELQAKASAASESGKATFEELAEAYRRLAARRSSLTLATDAEIETLAHRIIGRPPQK
jgi:hypothetical protein